MIEKEFEDGTIEITEVAYHRGTIPVIQGMVHLDWYKIQGELKMGQKESELLEWYYDYNLWDRNFTSCYIEYLSPGSPDLGFNLMLDYPEIPSIDELKEDLEYLHEKAILGREEIIANRLVYLIKQINEYYYKAEEAIYEIKRQLEAENV